MSRDAMCCLAVFAIVAPLSINACSLDWEVPHEVPKCNNVACEGVCINEVCQEDCGFFPYPCCPAIEGDFGRCPTSGVCITKIDSIPTCHDDCGDIGEPCCEDVHSKLCGEGAFCGPEVTCVEAPACSGSTEHSVAVIDASECVVDVFHFWSDTPDQCLVAYLAANYDSSFETADLPNGQIPVTSYMCSGQSNPIEYSAMTVADFGTCTLDNCPDCTECVAP